MKDNPETSVISRVPYVETVCIHCKMPIARVNDKFYNLYGDKYNINDKHKCEMKGGRNMVECKTWNKEVCLKCGAPIVWASDEESGCWVDYNRYGNKYNTDNRHSCRIQGGKGDSE